MSKKPQQVMMHHLQVVIALIKANDLHEGIWQLVVTFGTPGVMHAQDGDNVYPAVAVPLVRIGLVQVDKFNPLAADAATVNPRSRIILPEFAHCPQGRVN